MNENTVSLFDWIQLIATVVGTIALVATFVVYYRQLRTMGSQLEATRQGSNGQNILALANFLQAEEVRAARTLVFQRLAKRNLRFWSETEKRAAARVCSTYGVAGVILQTGVIPIEPFLENWGPSIYRSYKILLPFIREMQKPEHAGPSYWSTFEWLYSQVSEKYPYLCQKY